MSLKSLNRTKTKPIFTLPPYKVEQIISSTSEIIDWGLEMLSVPDSWRDAQGAGVKVAVLDTGADLYHPDLRSSVVKAEDFTNSAVGAQDIDGHGTHVAGTIAAKKNRHGVVGVAPEAELLIAKVLGDFGYGTEEAVANGINWAIENDADIISMSLASSLYSKKVHAAVKAAYKVNKTIICTASNEGSKLETMTYPGKFEETIAVGTIDSSKKVSGYSKRESQVDIVAPGDQVLSTYPTGGYAELSGSSMTTPLVSGIIALMFSKFRRFSGANPLEDREELIRHLRETATNLGPDRFDPGYGYGLINPEDLLSAQSRFLLNLIPSDDLTKSGKKKLSKFMNRGKTKPSVNNSAHLQDGYGEIRGGVRIKI